MLTPKRRLSKAPRQDRQTELNQTNKTGRPSRRKSARPRRISAGDDNNSSRPQLKTFKQRGSRHCFELPDKVGSEKRTRNVATTKRILLSLSLMSVQLKFIRSREDKPGLENAARSMFSQRKFSSRIYRIERANWDLFG